MNPNSATTKQVEAFYNAHPYPPPVDNLDNYRQRWQDQGRKEADFHLYWHAHPYKENLSVLVAGCGTSQAVKHALRNPANHIVGIDISETSVQHTKKLKEKYKLDNLDVYQLPITRVSELECTFDKIACTGVLHHLPDPDAGLRALHNVLNPEGALNLMVYATYGRVGVYMLQDYARLLGVEDTDDDISDFANTLMELPPNHPLAPLLGQLPDFRTKAGLADALLNPQDRAYTVPQLFDFIHGAGLSFSRWVRQAAYLPHCGLLREIPHNTRLTQLPIEEQYAAVELFRGTILRHSLIAYRNDSQNMREAIDFDDDRWEDYIPIRRARTIVVKENLPPNATAVLINQSHTDTDIYLTINAIEERLFDAVDNQHSIIEIIKKLKLDKKKNKSFVRTFFKRLWYYDQVVFRTTLDI